EGATATDRAESKVSTFPIPSSDNDKDAKATTSAGDGETLPRDLEPRMDPEEMYRINNPFTRAARRDEGDDEDLESEDQDESSETSQSQIQSESTKSAGSQRIAERKAHPKAGSQAESKAESKA